MAKVPEQVRRTKGPHYTPVSKRQDKPDGIAWIVRNHPDITDGQISRLIGTTKTTIAAIRDRTHWNIANITPKDPVTLGLCSQRELDALVAAVAKKAGVVPERSEEHTSELQSLMRISYAVFCLKKKKKRNTHRADYIHLHLNSTQHELTEYATTA